MTEDKNKENENQNFIGHGINAHLIGDIPTHFDAWNFIEPKNRSIEYKVGIYELPNGTIKGVTITSPVGRKYHTDVIYGSAPFGVNPSRESLVSENLAHDLLENFGDEMGLLHALLGVIN